MALYWVGAILSLVGGIWLLVVAFKQSVAWGICSLLIPFVAIVFAIKYWSVAKVPFLISLVGSILLVYAMYSLGASAMSMPA